jgi:hypothetical protein
MSSRLYDRSRTCWRTMAVVEVARSCGDLDDILEDISFDSRLDPLPAPNADARRFALVVNASRGPDRSAMAAYALLSALEAIAEDGGLPGFHIVCGEEWLHAVLTERTSDTWPRAAADRH